MANNEVGINTGSSANVATMQCTRDGVTTNIQLVCIAPPFKLIVSNATYSTSVTNIFAAGEGAVSTITYTGSGGAAESPVLTLYDEGTSPTGSGNDIIWSGALAVGGVISLNIPLTNGLSYKVSRQPTLGQNLVITYWQGT